MLRWNGLYVERRKMYPSNRNECIDEALNNQHTTLDLSWMNESKDRGHLTLEQKKANFKAQMARLYREKSEIQEQNLFNGSKGPIRVYDEELQRQLKSFRETRSLPKRQPEPIDAHLVGNLKQYSTIENIIYDGDAEIRSPYRLGRSTLLHPSPF